MDRNFWNALYIVKKLVIENKRFKKIYKLKDAGLLCVPSTGFDSHFCL